MRGLHYKFIKSGKRLIKVNYDEILFIKGLGNYVELSVKGKKKYTYYKALKDLIDELPDEFMRVHNSHIINLNNVDHIEDNHLVIDGHSITVAKSYRRCLANSVEQLML